MKVRGRFQAADTRNGNGRIYPSELWERVLNEDRVKDMLESRRMLGEVEHPSDGTTNLARVSHIVTGLRRDGNAIIGEAEVLNTPSGLIIQELLRRGVPVGISSRGRGSSLTKNGAEYVNPADFVLETFDFVYKPSTPGAYPELQESVLAGSPYAKDTPMSAKIDQIKKFDVRAGEIAEQAGGKLATSDLLALHRECVEIRGSLQTLAGGLNEAEQKDHGKYIQEVDSRISETYELLSAKLDKAYAGSDLSRRVESVIKSQASGSDSLYRDLLKEAKEENTYLRTRLDEIAEIVESSDDDILRRYNAATQLCQETLDKLQEATSALAEVTAEHESLRERYDAAVELVAGVQEHQAAGRMAYLVREALEQYPVLGKFVKTLRSCGTEAELTERVTELVEGLNLDSEAKSEDLASRLNLSAAIADESVDANETISESVLPRGKKVTAGKAPDARRGNAEKILQEGATSGGSDADFLNELLQSTGLN